MKWLINLIIFSLLVSMAGLSNAITGLVDPTRPANYVEKPEHSTTGENSSGKEINQKQDQQQASEAIPDFMLNAIKIGRSSRMAIINGKTLSPGQKIGSAKLVRINSSSVVMDVEGKAITVTLLPDSIKKHSSR